MKTFFYYTKQERQGIFLFCLLFTGTFILPKIYGRYYATNPEISWEAIQLDSIPEWIKKDTISLKIASEKTHQLFLFDPNTVSKMELKQLGLSERVVKTLLNFRNKGGRFYQKDDLLKIYGMDESWYQEVKDSIVIKQVVKKYDTRKKNKQVEARTLHKKYPKRAPILIKVNQASAEEWAKLRGIGPVLSSRIVKFREKLGGFYTLKQVNETYGLPDSTFQKILPQLELEVKLKLLPINQLETKALATHPYIDWKNARIITSYREQHGAFSDFEALKAIHGLEEEFLNKVRPYLGFE